MANKIIFGGKVQDTQYDWNGKTVAKFVYIITPEGAIAETFTVTKQKGGGTTDNQGFAIDETKKFIKLASDIVFEPELSNYGSHAVYTAKEVNDWLANPASVSGGTIGDDWRISAGEYQVYTKAKLAIDFKEVDGKRIITRIHLKSQNDSYSNFANQHMFFTFTIASEGNIPVVKECVLKVPSPSLGSGAICGTSGNCYLGSWPTQSDWPGFTTSEIYLNQMYSTSFPARFVKGDNEYAYLKVTGLSMENVESIGDRAFAVLKNVSQIILPKCTTIGEQAFTISRLTKIYAPSATTIGQNAFYYAVNSPSTHVTLPSKFNTQAEKDRIFRAGYWSQISFTWV